MIMRRAETDPSTAINQLTRDMARIRSDLDNIRSALTYRGRQMLQDATGHVGHTTTRAAQQTGEYFRQHPGTTAGVLIGIVAVVLGIVLGVNQMRR